MPRPRGGLPLDSHDHKYFWPENQKKKSVATTGTDGLQVS